MNEKASLIRSAFLREFDEAVVQDYLLISDEIHGQLQGEYHVAAFRASRGARTQNRVQIVFVFFIFADTQ